MLPDRVIWMPAERVVAGIAAAQERGAPVRNGDRVGEFRLAGHGKCQRPFHFELRGTRTPLWRWVQFEGGPTETLRYRREDQIRMIDRIFAGDDDECVSFLRSARCRRCPACMHFRARLWEGRANVECATWARTWFVTLTMRSDKLAGDAKSAAREVTLWHDRFLSMVRWSQ